MKVKLSLIDVAEEFRKNFGDKADQILGRPVPEHDWRWCIEYGDGGEVTYARRATAEQVASEMIEKGWEL